MNGKREPGTKFSLENNNKSKKFSTNFEYGNMQVDLKSNITGDIIKLNVKLTSKDFNFTGTVTLDEKIFNQFQSLFQHVMSNIKK